MSTRAALLGDAALEIVRRRCQAAHPAEIEEIVKAFVQDGSRHNEDVFRRNYTQLHEQWQSGGKWQT
jgi:hypothetical protein